MTHMPRIPREKRIQGRLPQVPERGNAHRPPLGVAMARLSENKRARQCVRPSMPIPQLGLLLPQAPSLLGQSPVRSNSNKRAEQGHDTDSIVATDSASANATALAGARPSESVVRQWQVLSSSELLSATDLAFLSNALGTRLPEVHLHRDDFAERVAWAHDAAAVTVGSDVYLGEGATREVLMHEFVHVGQGNKGGSAGTAAELEAEAHRLVPDLLAGRGGAVATSAAPGVALRHPALPVLRRASSWLLGRATNTVSRHVARHGRRIAGRAVHGIFRNPRRIRTMLQQTVREGVAITQRTARHGADDVIEEGGYRIFRQSTATPGKFRFVVQRQFDRAIGTQGERILRIVIDETGRIVTAFPADRLLTLGAGALALDLFTAQTAEASDRLQAMIAADEQARENESTDVLTAIIDFLVDPSVAGEGEQLMLDMDREIQRTTEAVIRDIENAEQMTLTEEQRLEITEMVRASLGGPMLDNEED